MKKILSVLLVLTMVFTMFALTGCSSSEETSEDALSICVVVPSGFGDKSFNDSAKEGAEKLKSDLGVNVSYIECNNEGHKQQMMNGAEEADIVVCVGWEFWEIGDVANEYPDKKFIWIDNVVENVADYPNLECITYAQNEGSFLAGYIAAKMSETGVIGAVGGEDGTTINDFVVGYKAGAEYADKDVKVKVNYADGDYENPALGKELALALNSQKADVIFQIAGNTGSGVFQAAQEEGFKAIGVDMDQKLELPSFDEQILCSMKKEVGNSIYDTIKAYLDDETFLGGQVWVADMANGYVGIAYGGEDSVQLVSDELKAEVEELQGKIVDGKIKVETTR